MEQPLHLIKITASHRTTIMDSSPLAKLPAELRNNIYRLVLVDESSLKVDGKSVVERSALLRACVQIRDEAQSIFYENTFHVTCGAGDGKIAASWFKRNQHNLRSSTKIIIDFKMSRRLSRALELAEDQFTECLDLGDEWLNFDGVEEESPATIAQVDVIAPLIEIIAAESLSLANALSASISSGRILSSQMQVVKPTATDGTDGEFSSENCLMLMYSIFKDLGKEEGDAMRIDASEEGCIEGSLTERFYSMDWEEEEDEQEDEDEEDEEQDEGLEE